MNQATFPLRAHLMVFLATVLVAGSFIAAQYLSSLLNPFSLTLLRFICAAVFLLPLILIKAQWRSAILGIMPRAMIISFFYSAFFIGLFESLKYTTTLNTGTLYTLVPSFTAVICLFLFKDRIPHKKYAAYALGALGTCWVIFKGDIHSLMSFKLNYGDAIFLCGALCMCCYTVTLKYLYRGDALIPLVFCNLLGGIFWMSLALMLSGLPLDWHKIEGDALWYMGYLIIGATLTTMYLFQHATITLGPQKIMAYSYLNPAVLALLLWLVNDQTIDPIIIPGVLLSALATIVLQGRDTPKANEQT